MKIYRGLIYILPVVLFCSYQPLISLGANSTMNLELSLPLIWLVVFDVVAGILIIQRKKVVELLKMWPWLVLPVFMTISLLWGHDTLRGVLTGGVLWLVYFAVLAFVIFKKEVKSAKFSKNFLKVFFGAGVVVCAWCLIQCIMDVAGAARVNTLLCPGCVYQIFGFPHPNGFAAEPQFMGNLLLAPAIVSFYCLLKNKFFSRKILLALFTIFTATLFLTLSRGAIYAFGVAMIFLTVVQVVQKRNWKILLIWPVILLAFLFTLNLQGVFTELSKTNDTYVSGVSKVVNQLSLGVIDLGGSQVKKEVETNGEPAEDIVEAEATETEEPAEAIPTTEESIFDGYAEVSTNERVDSWKGAFQIWVRDPQTALFGVGLGGAPLARYEAGVYSTPKEIINNEYVTLLVEIGVVGLGLAIATIVMVVRAFWRSPSRWLLLTLLVAYAVSLCFFSGLPNALHIYLLTGMIYVLSLNWNSSRRKL